MLKFFILLLLPCALFAQVPQVPPPAPPSDARPFDYKKDICEFPDKEANFKGGPSALQQYITKNVRYPQVSILNNEEGKVLLAFVIERNGKISNVQFVEHATKALDSEALRLVEGMPKWIPAQFQGNKVRTMALLPINFTLD
jgi:TonB family protein